MKRPCIPDYDTIPPGTLTRGTYQVKVLIIDINPFIADSVFIEETKRTAALSFKYSLFATFTRTKKSVESEVCSLSFTISKTICFARSCGGNIRGYPFFCQPPKID